MSSDKTEKKARNKPKEFDPGRTADWPSADDIEYMVAWHDATLDAGHWFSLGHVRPEEAALLLCGFNPNKGETVLADAQRASTSDTTPDDLRDTLRILEDVQSSTPAMRRTLQEWIDFAKLRGLRYHRWVDEYLGALPTVGKKWTEDRLHQLSEYRKRHGTKAAAKHYGINESRVRALLPAKKDATSPTAHNPFPRTKP